MYRWFLIVITSLFIPEVVAAQCTNDGYYWTGPSSTHPDCRCPKGHFSNLNARESSIFVNVCVGTSYPRTPLYMFPSANNRLVFWLDGRNITGKGYITGNNFAVSTWNDLSGNGNNFTSSGGERPLFWSLHSDTTSGATDVTRHIMYYDGTDDYYQGPTLGGVDFSEGVTVLVVANVRAAPTLSAAFVEKREAISVNNSFSIGVKNAGNQYYFEAYGDTGNGNSVDLGALVPEKYQIIVGIFDPNNNNRGFVDGVAATPSAHTGSMTSNTAVMRSGRRWDVISPNGFLAANIAEMMLFNTVLTDAQILVLEDYLNSKWAAY